MSINSPSYLKGFYDATRSMGKQPISSLEIVGYETIWLRTPQFPNPTLSTTGAIEIPTPLGATASQPQQLKAHQRGQITLMEITHGHVNDLMLRPLTGGTEVYRQDIFSLFR